MGFAGGLDVMIRVTETGPPFARRAVEAASHRALELAKIAKPAEQRDVAEGVGAAGEEMCGARKAGIEREIPR